MTNDYNILIIVIIMKLMVALVLCILVVTIHAQYHNPHKSYYIRGCMCPIWNLTIQLCLHPQGLLTYFISFHTDIYYKDNVLLYTHVWVVCKQLSLTIVKHYYINMQKFTNQFNNYDIITNF